MSMEQEIHVMMMINHALQRKYGELDAKIDRVNAGVHACLDAQLKEMNEKIRELDEKITGIAWKMADMSMTWRELMRTTPNRT